MNYRFELADARLAGREMATAYNAIARTRRVHERAFARQKHRAWFAANHLTMWFEGNREHQTLAPLWARWNAAQTRYEAALDVMGVKASWDEQDTQLRCVRAGDLTTLRRRWGKNTTMRRHAPRRGEAKHE